MLVSCLFSVFRSSILLLNYDWNYYFIISYNIVTVTLSLAQKFKEKKLELRNSFNWPLKSKKINNNKITKKEEAWNKIPSFYLKTR